MWGLSFCWDMGASVFLSAGGVEGAAGCGEAEWGAE